MAHEHPRDRPRLGLDHLTVVPRNFEERSQRDQRDGSRRDGERDED